MKALTFSDTPCLKYFLIIQRKKHVWLLAAVISWADTSSQGFKNAVATCGL